MRTLSHLFPGLDDDWARLDGPAGSLVLGAAADAVRAYLAGPDVANLGGAGAASRTTEALLADARAAMGRLLGAPGERVVLGPSATALVARLAAAFEDRVGPGDELVCTELDHDANVSPWLDLARRTGATVRVAKATPGTLDLPPSALEDVLSDRTKVVALTAASNVVGTTPDLAAAARLAHAAGAALVVDAVHAVPHGLDVASCGADAVFCSGYKHFGPHVSALALGEELMATLRPPRIRPAPAQGPGAWERGSLAFELLPGLLAAAAYVEGLDWEAERAHEAELDRVLVDGLDALPGVRRLGDPPQRTTTVTFTVAGHAPAAVAEHLAERRVAVGHGAFYAVELFAALGLDGGVRAGLLHLNEREDVERLLDGLRAL